MEHCQATAPCAHAGFAARIKPDKEATDPAKGLTQEQIARGLIARRRISISSRELNLCVLTAEHARRCKKVHRRAGNSLLNKLHVEDWLAIRDQSPIDGEIKTPNQAAELPRMRAKSLALNRHIRNTNRRAQPVHPRSPRFAHSIPGRFHDRIVDFLELHSRPAHPDESDKRSQHFIAAFTDLVDTRIAQHSLQRKIDTASRATIT